jgi:hypothetical protein
MALRNLLAVPSTGADLRGLDAPDGDVDRDPRGVKAKLAA